MQCMLQTHLDMLRERGCHQPSKSHRMLSVCDTPQSSFGLVENWSKKLSVRKKNILEWLKNILEWMKHTLWNHILISRLQVGQVTFFCDIKSYVVNVIKFFWGRHI